MFGPPGFSAVVSDVPYNLVFKRSWDLGAYYVLGACLLLVFGWFLSAIPINAPFGAVVSVDDAFKNPCLLGLPFRPVLRRYAEFNLPCAVADLDGVPWVPWNPPFHLSNILKLSLTPQFPLTGQQRAVYWPSHCQWTQSR